jgi:ADP-heptose:LPS heptosyltransferase
MNVKALQRVDRWFGVPLCCGLTLVRTLFEKRSPRLGKLLVVKLAEQGSTVLAYAALRRAVEIFGRENVYFVAFEDNRFILDLLEVIPRENVFTVSVEGIGLFFKSMISSIRKMRRMKFDAAVDLEFFSRGSAALAFLSGAKQRAGFHAFFGAGPYRGDLMTHRAIYNPHLHTSEAFLALIEVLLRDPATLPTFPWVAKPVDLEVPGFKPKADDVAAVEKILSPEIFGRRPVFLLNPNASDLLPLRCWPRERYVEVAQRLIEKYPEVLVGFTGAPNEAKPTGDLVRQVGSERALLLAGKTTLEQLLVLYTLAEVLVTNDSGPAHFASLTPIDIVTLFGPETPELFAARTPRNTVLWAGIACSPCVNAYNNRVSPCRNNACMQALTVEQVFNAVCQAYERRKQAGEIRAIER